MTTHLALCLLLVCVTFAQTLFLPPKQIIIGNIVHCAPIFHSLLGDWRAPKHRKQRAHIAWNWCRVSQVRLYAFCCHITYFSIFAIFYQSQLITFLLPNASLQYSAQIPQITNFIPQNTTPTFFSDESELHDGVLNIDKDLHVQSVECKGDYVMVSKPSSPHQLTYSIPCPA